MYFLTGLVSWNASSDHSAGKSWEIAQYLGDKYYSLHRVIFFVCGFMYVFIHSCVLVQRTELGISCLSLLVSITFYETAFIEIGTYYGLG